MVALFSITLFVNAALLFIIEPLVAKMILPYLGGSPAVWNTSLAFYQICLLAGYAYAHFGSSWMGTKRHALLHLNLVVGALLLLPIVLPIHWFAAPPENPAGTVLAVLCVAIGFPFLVISAGAPLMQKWFAQSNHRMARDPYVLFAASNAGSMVGLLAYPLVIERHFTLSQQNHLWFFGYLVLSILTAVCARLYFHALTGDSQGHEKQFTSSGAATQNSTLFAGAIDNSRRLRWLIWSCVPSSLLSGVTTYVTTDIVSAPLLWVIPLALYLLSFVIAFARPGWAAGDFTVRRQTLLLIAAALTVCLHATTPVWLVLPLHLLAFFATALVCHGQLAQDRPAPNRLTEYYLWISLGGVIGGLFNALVAPQIFTGVFEYPLAMVAAGLFRPYAGKVNKSAWSRKLDWLLPPLLVLFTMVAIRALQFIPVLGADNSRLLGFGVAATAILAFGYRPLRFGGGLIAMLFIGSLYPPPFGTVLYVERSFFGAYRATHDPKTNRHLLFHGTTMHGSQNADEKLRLQPLSYYHGSGPAAQVLAIHAQSRVNADVAIVGLGTGALACHGTPKQHFTFYEIDPLIEKIARDDRLFTYLRDCPPKTAVVIGDARISLAKAPKGKFNLFVLDAFSSDVVPVHLLTREAVELYLSKTAEDGLLLFHISNRTMDLAPVLDRLAKELNLVALLRNDMSISPREGAEGKAASRWILLARQQQTIAPFRSDARWQHLNGGLGGDLWTDEFSDVLKVLHWR